ARVIQTLHTAHAIASLDFPVTLVVGRAGHRDHQDLLADYALAPHPNLRILAVPTLHLPALPIASYTHPRLAAWNLSYGLASLIHARLLPPARRPRLILARDPRLAWMALHARSMLHAAVIYEVHELFSTRAREPAPYEGARAPTRAPRIRGLEEFV